MISFASLASFSSSIPLGDNTTYNRPSVRLYILLVSHFTRPNQTFISNMPVTEVAIPHLKTDEESRKLFLSKWPEVKKYFLAKPGLTRAYSGWLTHENNKSVEDDFRFIFVVGEICLQNPLRLTGLD